jgi:hypothetical protein
MERALMNVEAGHMTPLHEHDAEDAVRAPALGGHPALRDHLAVEMGRLLDQQISWSSAGPHGPAVMMLVLSTTGAPLAWDIGGVRSVMITIR